MMAAAARVAHVAMVPHVLMVLASGASPSASALFAVTTDVVGHVGPAQTRIFV